MGKMSSGSRSGRLAIVAIVAVSASQGLAAAADQAVPGAGNAAAVALAERSSIVQTANASLVSRAAALEDQGLRGATLDAIHNPRTCVAHRSRVSSALKQAILAELLAEGLVNPDDDKTFPGGLLAGVFPPLKDDGSTCPRLPMAFFAAPGSVFGGHHSYPGGLPVHEAFNLESSLSLANGYRAVYGQSDHRGLPVTDRRLDLASVLPIRGADVEISRDVMIAAPIWHDWAKAMVFQWNADGTEFAELNFGGAGKTDNYGAAGDSRTGGHHIIGLAESMSRGLRPDLVITQASAHSTPTSGDEYKVVNWLRAAAIPARIDPVERGYLYRTSANELRLPPLRQLGSVDLPAGQPFVLVEYVLHNISDSDFILTGPAVTDVEAILRTLAPHFGFNPTDPEYNTRFRNPVLSHMTAERLLMLYGNGGTEAVEAEVELLHELGVI